MKNRILVSVFTTFITLPVVGASVQVDRYFQGSSQVNEVVSPAQFKVIPIGPLRAGDQVGIQVVAKNKVYNDITACIATEAEAQLYPSRGTCRGFLKAATPIILRDQVRSDDNYYLILDNRYAALIRKNVTARITIRRAMSDDEVARLQDMFERVQEAMIATFERADLKIFLKPCGQSNAYSNTRTADITVCSEFIYQMAMQKNQGALVAVLLHEYGHSLLNRWGEPGASEEDMADQFAIAMLLRGGDSGRRLLQEWIAYWQQQDSRAEAVHQIEHGGTHTLSVQRARNIQNAINYPEDFTRRWNKMFYRHMTRESLEHIIAHPSKSDDVDLAGEALRTK